MAGEFDALADAVAAELIPTATMDLMEALEKAVVQEGNIPQLQAYAKMVTQYASQFYNAGQAIVHQYSWRRNFMGADNMYHKYATALANLKKSSDTIVFKNTLINLEMAFINFQTQLNNFLGQHIHSVLLYQDDIGGQVNIYEHEGNFTREMLTPMAGNSKKITLNVDEMMRAYNLLEKIENVQMDSLNATYAEVQNRAAISMARIKHGAKKILILWYIGGWDGNWVNGYGPLGEAYAAFYYNLINGMTDPFTGGMESNVATFVRHKTAGVENVDSTSALFEGDVSIGKEQYHIKNVIGKGIVSAPGFSWGLQIAEYIATVPPAQLSKEVVKSVQEQLARLGAEGKSVHTTRISEQMKKNLNSKLGTLMGPFDKEQVYKVNLVI